METEVHPAAAIFPMLTEKSYQALKNDIEKHGQREPVVFYEGKLIDGRNRLRACRELGIEPSECELESDIDPIAYVLSANLHRRQLKTTQKAMCAAKLAGLPSGRPSLETVQNCTVISAEDAATLFCVSRTLVFAALEVLRKGSPTIIGMCEAGLLSASKAAEFIEAIPNKREQTQIAKNGKQAIVDFLKPQDEVEHAEDDPDEVEDEEDDEPDGVHDAGDDFASIEDIIREKYRGRLAVAAARLEALAEKLRKDA